MIALPALPSTYVIAVQSVVFAITKTHSAEVPTNFGPAMPGEFEYPQEFNEITSPLPADTSMG